MRTYTLKSRNARRGLGLAVATAVALSLFVVPASAEAVKGTASIASGQRNPLAGTVGAPFDITISNLGVGVPTSLNHIVIVPPPSLYTATAGTGPNDNWQSRTNSAGQVIFEGGTVSPGSSAVFRVTADVFRTDRDVAREWKIFVSDNAGQTLVLQDPSSGGALTSTIRVLQVLSTQIISPSGATDNSVTEQQNNVTVQTRILNAGSAALSVTGTLVRASGSSSGTTQITNQSANPATIPSQSQGTFNFGVTFAGPGTIVLRGDGTATGADAIDANSAVINVLTRAVFRYIDDSLQPLHVSPGNPYSFRLNMEKTGQVGVNFNMANTRFVFGPNAEFQASLAEPTGVGQGAVSRDYTFASTTVPTSLEDGEHTPEIRMAATDENGAAVGDPVPIDESILLDRLAPILTPTLTPPPSQVEGEDPAATNGATLRFGGTIEKPEGSLCGNCSIVGAFLRQYNSAGGQTGDIPVNVSNNNGLLSGSYSGNYAPGAISVELHVSAISLALNSGTGVSFAVDVDNIAPEAVAARTGGNGNERRRIDVFLGENVAVPGKAKMSASDWRVDNHVVADADLQPSSGSGDRVVLTLGTTLGQDQEPVVTYLPGSAATQAHDRVGLRLDEFAMTAIDGILPDLPVVAQVAGMNKQDGEFWTNQTNPAFTVNSVTAGHQVCLFEDSNANGQINAGDTQLVCGIAQGSSITLVPVASLGTTDRGLTVLARATDARSNQGPTAGEVLNLDFTAPGLAGVSLEGNQVVLTFTESLARGRNFATDFTIHGNDGFPIQWKPNSVSGSGATRTLTINDSSYSSADVTEVEYEFLGADLSDRYQDRATNSLANFRQSV